MLLLGQVRQTKCFSVAGTSVVRRIRFSSRLGQPMSAASRAIPCCKSVGTSFKGEGFCLLLQQLASMKLLLLLGYRWLDGLNRIQLLSEMLGQTISEFCSCMEEMELYSLRQLESGAGSSCAVFKLLIWLAVGTALWSSVAAGSAFWQQPIKLIFIKAPRDILPSSVAIGSDQPDLVVAVGPLPLHHCSPLPDVAALLDVQVLPAERPEQPPLARVLAPHCPFQVPVLGVLEFGVGGSEVGPVVGVVVGDVVDSLSAVDVDDYLSAVLLHHFERHELVGVVDGLLDVQLVGVVVGHEGAELVPAGTDAVGHSSLREPVVQLVVRLWTRVLALGLGDVGVLPQLLDGVLRGEDLVFHWADYPNLVERCSEMALDDDGVVVGVAVADLESLAAEGADVAALSSPAALANGDDLEVVAAVVVGLSHLDGGPIRLAFRGHMESALAVEALEEAEPVVGADAEPLVLVAVEFVEDELVTVEEVGGDFGDLGDVED